jgi:hypothetical protein
MRRFRDTVNGTLNPIIRPITACPSSSATGTACLPTMRFGLNQTTTTRTTATPPASPMALRGLLRRGVLQDYHYPNVRAGLPARTRRR